MLKYQQGQQPFFVVDNETQRRVMTAMPSEILTHEVSSAKLIEVKKC